MLKKGEITAGSPFRRVPDMKKNIKITKIKKMVSLKNGIKKTIDWVVKKHK